MSTEITTMNNSPDTRFSLIGRLADADNADAWNEFAQIYQPLIFRIARQRGLQHADASEVTQDVLTRVAKAVDGWDPDRSKGTFRGWLYRITRNVSVDYLRKAAYTGGFDFKHQWNERDWYIGGDIIWSHVKGSASAIQGTQESIAHLFQRVDAEYIEVDSTRTSLTGTGGNLQLGKIVLS